MTNQVTICAKCKFYQCNGKSIWYNQLCSAVYREEAINPVTGKTQYIGKNDLGNLYFTDQRYAYCRDINQGNCEHFIESRPH